MPLILVQLWWPPPITSPGSRSVVTQQHTFNISWVSSRVLSHRLSVAKKLTMHFLVHLKSAIYTALCLYSHSLKKKKNASQVPGERPHLSTSRPYYFFHYLCSYLKGEEVGRQPGRTLCRLGIPLSTEPTPWTNSGEKAQRFLWGHGSFTEGALEETVGWTQTVVPHPTHSDEHSTGPCFRPSLGGTTCWQIRTPIMFSASLATPSSMSLWSAVHTDHKESGVCWAVKYCSLTSHKDFWLSERWSTLAALSTAFFK